MKFEVDIHDSNDGYAVRVIGSPAGDATAPLRIDLGFAKQLEALLDDSSKGVLTSEHLEETGALLFGQLFAGDLRDLYRESIAIARAQKERLRIQLTVDPSELAGLPWEMLYDPQDQYFLCLSDEVSLSRHVSIPEPARPLPVQLPLRVLVIAAGEADSSAGKPLAVDAEIAGIEAALSQRQQSGEVQLRVNRRTNLDSIRAQLKDFSPHVLHFIGHGRHENAAAVLVLEDESGQPFSVDEEQFRDLIGSARELRLVVLNACDTAKASQTEVVSGLARRILQRRVSAVVAMQTMISDKAAQRFSQTFYARLASGADVEEAVTTARQSLRDDSTLAAGDWSIPVLFARTQLGSFVRSAEAMQDAERSNGAQIWQRISKIADVIGIIGVLTLLPVFLGWLHSVWGPISCVPDYRFWGWMTAGLGLLVPIAGWVHFRQASSFRKRHLILFEVSLAVVLVFGFVRSVMGKPQRIPLPTTTFNIVVSAFGEGGRSTSAQGRQQVTGNLVCNSVTGAEFTNELSIALQRSIDSAGSATPQVRMQRVGYIHSQDEAIALAKELNATVLVWGWFLSNDTNSFEPHFVVNDLNEAWEPALLLTGLTSAQDKPEQVGLTQTRIGILTDFILGILSMQQDNVERAQQYFQRSLDTVLESKDAESLRPLLYYYAGRMDNHLGHTSEAEAKFDAGLAINREYAILYLNKGNILYGEARQVMSDPAHASKLLDSAAELYQRALDSLEKENTQFVDGKAYANLGHVAFTRGQLDRAQADHFEQALQEYATAEQQFAAAEAPGCHSAQVEISKGFVYEELQEFATAQDVYEQILAQSEPCASVARIARERLTVLSGSK